MKIIIAISALFAAALCLANPAESAFGRLPTVTKREAAAIKEASESGGAKALEILKAAASEKWAGGAIWFNLGNLQMSEGDAASAAESYRKAAELTPSFFLAHKNLAFALERLGKKEESIAQMKNALALSGGSDPDILSRFVSLRAAEGDFSAALNFCNQYLLYKPGDRRMLFAKAAFLFELGSFGQCEKICSGILASDPSDREALRLLGKSRAMRGDILSAVAPFEMLEKIGGATDGDRAFCADLFFCLKLYPEAAKRYLLAGKASRAENAALAALYSSDLDSALKLADTLPQPSNLKIKGLALAESGNSGAIEILKKYLAEKPSDSFAALRLGRLLLDAGKPEEADVFFAAAMSDDRYVLQSLYGSLNAAAARGDIRSALQIARKIEKIKPSKEISEYAAVLESRASSLE